MAHYISAAITLHKHLPIFLRPGLDTGTTAFALGDFHLYAKARFTTFREQQYEVGHSFNLTLIDHLGTGTCASPTSVWNSEKEISHMRECPPEPSHAYMLYLGFRVGLLLLQNFILSHLC